MNQCKALTLKGCRCTFSIAPGNKSYCKIHSKILNKKPDKKLPSKSIYKSIKKKYQLTKSECQKKLQDKIRANMIERDYKGWTRAQAIAISYAQVKKKYPLCRNKL